MGRKLLRMTAAVLMAVSLIVWLATGPNFGWTRTSVPVKTIDEVTGIEGISYEKRFVPGLEVMAGALLVSALLAGVSFLFRDKAGPTHPPR